MNALQGISFKKIRSGYLFICDETLSGRLQDDESLQVTTEDDSSLTYGEHARQFEVVSYEIIRLHCHRLGKVQAK